MPQQVFECLGRAGRRSVRERYDCVKLARRASADSRVRTILRRLPKAGLTIAPNYLPRSTPRPTSECFRRSASASRTSTGGKLRGSG